MSDPFISCRPIVWQWTHSAVHLPDFLSPWHAIEVASDLSRELGFAPTVPVVCPSVPNGFVETAVQLHSGSMPKKKVRFCDSTCLRLTSSVVDADYLVPHSALGHWRNKPWILSPPTSTFESGEDWDDAMLMQTSLDSPRQFGSEACSEPRDFLSDDLRSLVSLLQSPSSSRRFVSYGLAETSVGTRPFVLLDPTPDGLISQVRTLWPEYDDGVLRLHAVWPQPSDAVNCHHIIAEFLMDGELPHHSIEPVLEESVVWSVFGQTDVQRYALYHQRRLHHADVRQPFSDLCQRAHFVCTVRVLGRILPVDWTRNIVPGALVQLHAHPPRLHEPMEFVDYIQGLPTFFTDSLGMLGESIVPTPVWRFHLLLADGYRGVAESTVPIANVASPSAVADSAFSHWNMELPGSLVYAGLPFPESVVQNFIAYETDYEGVPCLIEVVCDESLGLPAPPQVAAFVSSVCTLQQLVSAINALWIFELVGVSLTVSDGVLTYDSDDRFRPRVGAFFSIHVSPEAPDGSSLLQVSQSLFMPGGMPKKNDLKVVPASTPFLNRFKKASNLQDPRPSRAPGLASASSGPSRPSAPVEPEPEDDDTPGDDDPDDDPDEDPEDAALSDDIPHHTAFVYHLQDDFFAFEVDEISSDTTLEQISDGWGLQYRELAALHTVNSPPSDHLDPGTETVIAELAQDADVRPVLLTSSFAPLLARKCTTSERCFG